MACLYSGTVAAALEGKITLIVSINTIFFLIRLSGVIQGVPAIAVSLDQPKTYPSREDKWPYDWAAENVMPFVKFSSYDRKMLNHIFE